MRTNPYQSEQREMLGYCCGWFGKRTHNVDGPYPGRFWVRDGYLHMDLKNCPYCPSHTLGDVSLIEKIITQPSNHTFSKTFSLFDVYIQGRCGIHLVLNGDQTTMLVELIKRELPQVRIERR